ncbi:aminoglycoside phosphotransferase family protein [Bacillus sp. 165]|uniref:aminoglycoside phosphotransferase family protein n=1 Tax=Bacillus sp. 165 TaxID=1529117 RepID=UPI001ADB8D87|nr:aminoglycoside phosphotransferase family protein [Bacillus sp. 165]MBO9130743.1 kinase [Bacillus sp. 165]
MVYIPEQFARSTVEIFAEKGKQWLNELPLLLEDCATRWSLKIQDPFPNLTYNYVIPVLCTNGTEAVLKLGVPCLEFSHEAHALRQYDGKGIVRPLACDTEKGAMLLEKLTPGQSLASITDEEHATSLIGQVMKQLWKQEPKQHSFPAISNWAKGLERMRIYFEGGTGPFPKQLVEKAESLFPQLIASISSPLLLHGDLHHDNVLSANREPWLAIDPKGVIGEAEYETVAYLRNHLLNHPNPKAILRQRIDQLSSELQLDRERMLSWGLCHCILSSWWSIEDHGYGWENTINIANMFDELLKKK